MPFITQGKTNLKYILIVVVLAVIVGGGILGYYYSWIKELDTRLAQLETRLPELKAPEEVPADETVDWKTYRNEEHGFEFRYPLKWKIEDFGPDYFNVFSSLEPYDGERLKQNIMKAQFHLNYSINEEIENEEDFLSKFLEKNKQEFEGGYPTTLILKDSFLAIPNKYGLKIIKFSGGTGDIGYLIPVKQDFSEIILIMAWNPDVTFDQIISTFKFLD